MGACLALARALALHDPNRRPFPLELSLASIFPFGSRDLRSGSAAGAAGVTDPGYSGARSRSFDGYRNVHPARNWHIRFSSDMDFSRARRQLVAGNALVA